MDKLSDIYNIRAHSDALSVTMTATLLYFSGLIWGSLVVGRYGPTSPLVYIICVAGFITTVFLSNKALVPFIPKVQGIHKGLGLV